MNRDGGNRKKKWSCCCRNSPRFSTRLCFHFHWTQVPAHRTLVETNGRRDFPNIYLWVGKMRHVVGSFLFSLHTWIIRGLMVYAEPGWMDGWMAFSGCTLVCHYYQSSAMSDIKVKLCHKPRQHLSFSPHGALLTISQAAGSCLKSECVSSTDTLFL